jgi:RNA polymerase sigma-70 factor (ECF subfamily)
MKGAFLAEATAKIAPRSQAESADDFSIIIDRYQKRLVAIAYRMLGNFEDARDFVQEAFLRLWKTGIRRKSGQEVFPLLARMLVNLCIDRLRRRRLRQFFSIGEKLTDLLPSPDRDPEQEMNDGELVKLLETAVERLKPKQKAIFVLRDIEGYSVRETASITGCSENSVLTNLHLAHKNLRFTGKI